MNGIEIAIIVLLLAVNAFLAASEIAIVSARRARLNVLVEEGNDAARRVIDLADSPSGFLATIQVGITLAGFFASAVGAVSLANLLEEVLVKAPVSFVSSNASAVALVVITAILSFISIVFGELVPKTIAVGRAEAVALAVARPIEVLAVVTRPIVALLTMTTNGVLRLFGVHERSRLPQVSQAEILAMLETAEDEGVVEADEADLVEEALGFGDIMVRRVMVPRVAVEAVEAATPLGEALDRFLATGYSRLPIYRETPDDLVGILYVKDAFRVLWADRAAETKPVEDLARPAYFVPETKPIDELLQELRRRHTHIAIVVDEYGGMAGLVTLEDLLEELVGEITDEFDRGYESITEVAPNTFDVDGRLPVVDLLNRLELTLREVEPYEAESVGGLIADRLGRIPTAGDTITLGPLRLTVKKMDGYRVALLRIERLPDPEDGDGGNG